MLHPSAVFRPWSSLGGLLLGLAVACPGLCQDGWVEVLPGGTVPGLRFGRDLMIHGDLLMIGAPGRDGPGFGGPPVAFEGQVSVFMLQPNGEWVETQVLMPVDSHSDQAFGLRVELSGNRAFVSAPGDDELGVRAGAVYVLDRINGQWQVGQKILASDGEEGDTFGASMDFDQGRLVVAAPHEGSGHLEGWGKLYAYEEQAGVFVETQDWTSPDVFRDDWFGYHLELDGDLLVVNSFNDDIYGFGSGSVWFYEHDGNEFVPMQKLVPPSGAPFDHFGTDLMVRGGVILCAAYRENGGGALYEYRRDTSGLWSLAARHQPEWLRHGAALGFDIAHDPASGNFWISAPRDVGAPFQEWSVGATQLMPGRVFQEPSARLNSQSGYTLHTDGVRWAMSAPFDDLLGAGVGRVHVFTPDAVGWRESGCAGDGLLWADGSLDLASGNLRLVGRELPPNSFGFAFYGTSAASIPISAGLLCVAGPHARILPPAPTDAAGSLALDLDLSSFPFSGGPNAWVAGSTWHLQLWVRDNLSPAGARLSSSLVLRLEP